jgi:5'-deoxynucleotidase YfbR-like HD superfamily hydrolase
MSDVLYPFRDPLTTWPGGSHMWVAGSKKWIDPLRLRIDEVEVEDIALALSNICRYTGHVRRLSSVAEHSVKVADVVRYELDGDRNAALAALLHDACEAYLSDVPKPIKDHPNMQWFRDLEDEMLFEVIYPRFGVVCTPSSDTWQMVKQADRHVFNQEWELDGGHWSAPNALSTFMYEFNQLRYGL